MTGMFAWVAFTVTALILLLVAERRNWFLSKGAFKALASTGFVGAAVAMGATETLYGQIILAGLSLSWWGDVFLISPSNRLFQAGLVGSAHF